jgi:hypothetical protein
MRATWLVWIGVLGGCDLYFGHPPHALHPDASETPPDAVATTSCPEAFLCRDGMVYEAPPVVPIDNECPPPNFTSATAIATCQYGCSASGESVSTSSQDACGLAPAMTYDCNATGACTNGQTQGCGGALACGYIPQTGSCTCSDKTWSCTPECSDTLCSAEAVQKALVGTWTGTVTPPSFAPPYTISLTIAPDGSWIGTTSESYRVVFYYGDNGGVPIERILVLAQTGVGAFATVGLFGNEGIEGLLSAIRVDAHRLTFTFTDSWLSCTRQFAFDLQR